MKISRNKYSCLGALHRVPTTFLGSLRQLPALLSSMTTGVNVRRPLAMVQSVNK